MAVKARFARLFSRVASASHTSSASMKYKNI